MKNKGHEMLTGHTNYSMYLYKKLTFSFIRALAEYCGMDSEDGDSARMWLQREKITYTEVVFKCTVDDYVDGVKQ